MSSNLELQIDCLEFCLSLGKPLLLSTKEIFIKLVIESDLVILTFWKKKQECVEIV